MCEILMPSDFSKVSQQSILVSLAFEFELAHFLHFKYLSRPFEILVYDFTKDRKRNFEYAMRLKTEIMKLIF